MRFNVIIYFYIEIAEHVRDHENPPPVHCNPFVSDVTLYLLSFRMKLVARVGICRDSSLLVCLVGSNEIPAIIISNSCYFIGKYSRLPFSHKKKEQKTFTIAISIKKLLSCIPSYVHSYKFKQVFCLIEVKFRIPINYSLLVSQGSQMKNSSCTNISHGRGRNNQAGNV